MTIQVLDHPLLTEPDVAGWREDLRRAGYFIDPRDAFILADWWTGRTGHLTLQGEPGSGKTLLAIKAPEVRGAPLEVMPCYDGIGKDVALYSWDRTLQNIIKRDAKRRGAGADEIKRQIYSRDCLIPGVLMRALMNPHPDTCVLIDEVDKVGQGKYFEALMLEVLGSMQITIIETGERIRPVSGSAPHIFITSNATDDAPLSSPLLRRGPFIKFHRVTPARMSDIFRENAPEMSERMRWSCVLFIHHAQKTEMEKPIALSEAVQWVQCLARRRVAELTPEIVYLTLAYLAKGEKEAQRLAGVIRPILDHISANERLREAA